MVDLTPNLKLSLIQDGYAGNYPELLRDAMTKIDASFAAPMGYPEYVPALSSDGDQPTFTYAYQKGYFQKAGPRVYVEGAVGLSGIAGGSGHVQLLLPFPVLNVADYSPTFSAAQLTGYVVQLPNTKNVAWRGMPGTSYARLVASDFMSAQDEYVGVLGSLFFCRFKGDYFTDQAS